jgi:sialic acid synthase SpsE
MPADLTRPLFIFEMANNHNGSVDEGLSIIYALSTFLVEFGEFDFAVKLQYRDWRTLTNPRFKSQHTDLKFTERFTKTVLRPEDYLRLKTAITESVFDSICTPFDDPSVDLVVSHEFDWIKVPSCYVSDAVMLRAVRNTELPSIASVAGATPAEIDLAHALLHPNLRVLMHCVGEYPTQDRRLNLSGIWDLRARHNEIVFGYSTHERPANYRAIQVAIGAGAWVFEKHVTLKPGNRYSATIPQLRKWLLSARRAFAMLGPAERGRQESRTMNELREFLRAVRSFQC